MSEDRYEGIAIIGMAGRFPGAENVEEFWQNLLDGKETVSSFSDEELAESGLDAAAVRRRGRYMPVRGVLKDADCFDAAFFGVHPKEAEVMDPQQRVFLETCWAALERAGYAPSQMTSSVGVFAGQSFNTYYLYALHQRQDLIDLVGPEQVMFGNEKDYLTTRVAYKLGLKGPAINVSTACSTSLVAVCQAVQSLLTYQCDVALAGGVSVTVPQKRGYYHDEGNIGSADGHTRTFDAQAAGTVFGNGVGVAVLKRLAEAVADGDEIYAVIKGAALNNDGSRRVSFTAPGVEGQSEVVAMAHALAGVDPETITYVEAHGTATPLGDPIEIAALTKAFRFGTDAKQFCGIGSVKTNVGHLDAAAGVTGLIKTALALHHKVIPASLHFTTPNPKLDLENSPFYVNASLQDWKTKPGVPRRAGVSAFGTGGTNAHVVLEESPELASSGPSRPWQLLMLSAKTPVALDRATSDLSQHLKRMPPTTDPDEKTRELADAAYTLQAGRSEFAERRIVVCGEATEGAAALDARDPKRVFSHRQQLRQPPVVFMFPGQGAQYPGMGAELYRLEPVFRAEVDRCCDLLLPILGIDLRKVMFPPSGLEEEAKKQLVQTRFTQPALFVIEYALAKLWMSWGIKPAAMIGHSVGEYAAACLSGVFSVEEAIALVARRGALVQAQPGGAMLSVRLPEKEVLPRLHSELDIAAINSPNLCVVAGPHEAIAALEKEFESEGVAVRHLHTSHAFHSQMMDPVLDPFTELLRRAAFGEPQIPFVSNVTARWITPEEAKAPKYWAGHVRQTVRFADGIAELLKDSKNVLLEVGPGQTLSTLSRQHPAKAPEQIVLSSLALQGAIEPRGMLETLGRLWMAGVEVDWQAFYVNEQRRRVVLPTYPFERKRYWPEPPAGVPHVSSGAPVQAAATTSTNLSRSVTTGETAPVQSLSSPLESSAQIQVGATRKERLVAAARSLLQELSGSDLSNVNPATGLLEFGLDSLLLTQAAHLLQRKFGVSITFRQLMEELNSIDAIASYLDSKTSAEEPAEAAAPSKPAVPEKSVVAHPDRSGPFPLTEGQKEIWLAVQMGGAAAIAYNESLSLQFRGAFDAGVFRAALQQVIERHPIVLASIDNEGGTQQIKPETKLEAPLVDVPGNSEAEREHELASMIERDTCKPFDLETGPLLRVTIARLSSDHHVVIWTAHHIICDGWSARLLVHELGKIYSALKQGVAPVLEAPASFREYAMATQADCPAARNALNYWTQRFADPPPQLDLPTDRPHPLVRSAKGATLKRVMGAAEHQALKRVAAQQGSTLVVLLMGALHTLLYRLTGQADTAAGLSIAGQAVSGKDCLVGHCVNFLPIRTQIRPEAGFHENLASVKKNVMDAYEHHECSIGSILQQIKVPRVAGRLPLVEINFSVDGDASGAKFEGVEFASKGNPKPALQHDLFFYFAEGTNGLVLNCFYNTDLFDATTIERWLDHYQTLLDAIVRDPEQSVSNMSVLTESQRNELVCQWNDTAAALNEKNQVLHGLIEEQAAKAPERTALVFNGREMTYRELDARSNQLAWHLRGLGVGRDTLVGLYHERSLDMMVALLGILKAGGAYVPLDPSFPQDRLRYMVENSGMRVLITQSALDGRLPTRPGSVVRMDADCKEIAKHSRERLTDFSADPHNLAYVLYTSGSTGKPKGVAIEHVALVNFLRSMQREPGFDANDTLLAVTTLSFDIAGLELYLPLISGGKVVIASREDTHDPAQLMERIEESKCTVMQATPATWRGLIEAGWGGSPKLKILCGGESFPPDLGEKLLTRCRELWNMYGPTETTVWSTVSRVTSVKGTIPIGKPIANTDVYVLDANRNLAPVGVVGELYIGGVGVARGYWHRPELTEERFVANPYKANSRMYRTGDLARWLADGTVECLGRVDNQVKIRGFRIELGEIEAVLSRHESVRQCVVVAREDTPGDKKLVAYYAVAERQTEPAASDLRSHLKNDVPDYMVPSAFVVMEKLPLTPNGKIDRKALPSPKAESAVDTTEFFGPRDPLEQALANIWSKVLKVNRVGLRDNFFDLGGHSLNAVVLMSEVKKLTGKTLPLATLFQAATVETFAAILRGEGWKPFWSSLVPIRTGGTRNALFLVHGAEGNVLLYRQMARHLDPDQPVYGLQSQGLNGDGKLKTTIQEMASEYVKEILALQPEGPYFIGGYCLGGTIAFEMAQQLTAMGKNVELAAMLDTYNAAQTPQSNRWFQKPLHLLQNFWFHCANILSLPENDRERFLKEKVDIAIGRLSIRLQAALHAMRLLGKSEPDDFPHLMIKKVNDDAARRYTPRPYTGRVAVIRSKGYFAGLTDPNYGWGKVVREGLEIHQLPMYPKGMLIEPFCRELANTLELCLHRPDASPECVQPELEEALASSSK